VNTEGPTTITGLFRYVPQEPQDLLLDPKKRIVALLNERKVRSAADVIPLRVTSPDIGTRWVQAGPTELVEAKAVALDRRVDLRGA
jgi:hypothetical protein